MGNFSASLYCSPSYTVPSPPTILPVQWKMLSPSGKAEMPASFVIMRDISSDWSLLFTDCPAAGAAPTVLPAGPGSPP